AASVVGGGEPALQPARAVANRPVSIRDEDVCICVLLPGSDSRPAGDGWNGEGCAAALPMCVYQERRTRPGCLRTAE
ncbi:hypothetical protein BRM82_13250, partial [Xanthomonas oryzae pv. oryzae]